MHRPRLLASFTGLALIAAAGTAALAGPLTPPAGPVTSTNKTLTEVEPRIAVNATNTPGDVANQFKISQPGSYYLTADMTATPELNPCIVINTSDVTLDLNGFSIRTSATAGVTIAGDRVTVRNGRIGLSGGNVNAGVLIQPGAGEARLEELTISVVGSSSACVRSQASVSTATLNDSILIGGAEGLDTNDSATAWTVTNVQCRSQGSTGLIVGNRSVVQNCVVRDVSNGGGNFGHGIFANTDTVVRNCQVVDSSTSGVGPRAGITTAGDCIIENCQVRSRGAFGINLTGSGNTARNCDVRMEVLGNTAINLTSSLTTVSDNVVYAPNGTGIQLNDTIKNMVIRNRFLLTVTPIGGTALANNIIGPTAGNGNPTTNTNPHANFVN